MDTFPPEVIEIIIEHLSLNDKLTLRKVCRCLNTTVAARIPQLVKQEPCELTHLLLRDMKNRLALTVKSTNIMPVYHFLQLEGRANEVWRVRNTPKSDCSIKIMKDYAVVALFDNAKIGHLEICKDWPFYLDDGNTSVLRRLFTGCTIDRVILVIDIKTLTKLSEVPSFLAEVHCKSVEFVLKRTEFHEMIQPFNDPVLVSALAAAGIEEVVFSGDSRSCRENKKDMIEMAENPSNLNGSFDPFTMLLSLVDAGISRITVDRRSFWRGKHMTAQDFIDFLTQLSTLNRPMNITIDCSVSEADILMQGRAMNGAILTCGAREDATTKWHQVSITKE